MIFAASFFRFFFDIFALFGRVRVLVFSATPEDTLRASEFISNLSKLIKNFLFGDQSQLKVLGQIWVFFLFNLCIKCPAYTLGM